MARPYNRSEKVATVLAQICCVDNQLPQGSPTSPIIANMICAKLDSQLQRLAKEHRCFYTRYADDITFSTSLSSFPRALAKVEHNTSGNPLIPGSKLNEIVEKNGFTINPDKVRLQSSDRRQEITGLTVNKLPNVPRKFLNQVRAMLHDWEKNGYGRAQENHFQNWRKGYSSPYSSPTSFAAIVRGKIEYIGMIRGTQNRTYRKLLKKLSELDPTFKKSGLVDMREQIFISYSHKDKKWLEELKRHLTVLEHNHKLVVWDDTKIEAGSKWRQEIEKALNSAKAAILLVSDNFLVSDFIREHELPPLLQAAEKEGLKILWIPVTSTMYEYTEIVEYQCLTEPSRPLNSLKKSERNRELVEICRKIAELAS